MRTVAATGEARGDSLGRRIRDVFIAPGRLAGRLGDDPPWLDALIVATLLAALAVALLPDQLLVGQMEGAVTRRGEPVEITSSPEEVARWGRYLGMMATLAMQPAFAFVTAGALTLIFSILGGDRIAFRCYLALASYAIVVPALGTLVEALARLAAPDPVADPFAFPFLRTGEANGVLLLALGLINPFFIWMLVVLGVGVSTLAPRRSRARTVTVLLGAYLLLLVTSAAILR